MKQQAGALLSSIAIDRDAPRKVSVQLYLALRDIILSGGLGPGDRLPASRILAREVGVSRTTVIDAIERLVAEGMLVSRVGAGTFVSDILEHQRPTPPVAAPPVCRRPRRACRIPSTMRSKRMHRARSYLTAQVPSSRHCPRSMRFPLHIGRGFRPDICAVTARQLWDMARPQVIRDCAAPLPVT
ncbi:winged helix-turn-helix domain-containing protein [Roseovarius pelagicus]|uniref:Winged helix-turn-helix domain-containing protein n=1 Tax=Roseovarius pelagicus TaxID=2980108 RepID=A0ABY6DDV0_9RHOB|nr:winged helix-turn-helix domain-containing protein [Roseovarius pelagicus]UXX84329.1 winged helix-turn-helix domain-containing protein [Roseovarius pelagicus]